MMIMNLTEMANKFKEEGGGDRKKLKYFFNVENQQQLLGKRPNIRDPWDKTIQGNFTFQ